MMIHIKENGTKKSIKEFKDILINFKQNDIPNRKAMRGL